VGVVRVAAEDLLVDLTKHLNNKGGHVLNDAAFYGAVNVAK